jgi:hypothetical protein
MFRRLLASALVIGCTTVAALAVPAAHATPAVQSTTCNASLQLQFSPGLTLGEKQQKMKIQGSLSGCVGGGVASATLTKGIGRGTMSCTSGSAEFLINLKWNTGQLSQIHGTVDPSGTITGTVTRGKFTGEDVTANLTVTPGNGQDCFFVPVTTATATGQVSL